MRVAVRLAQHGETQVDGDVDETTRRGGLLLAFRLSQHSEADVERNTDQRAAAAGRRADLVAFGLAQSSKASVQRHVDQAAGGRGLLLASNLTQDGATQTNGDANEAFGL